jgi:mono/diheme cytochrome c family protein
MKTRGASILSISLISMFFFFISGGKGLSQNEPKPANAVGIPDILKAVFQNSCIPCHWKGGGIKSTLHVNFSKWDDYEPDTQAQKARKICSVLADDKMPPASAREKSPAIVLTKEQIETVCKWSESLPKESQTVSSKQK